MPKNKVTTCNHRWKIWPRAPGPHLLPWELLGIQEDSRWISALLSIRSANAASAMTQERESWSLSSGDKSICNHPCMFQLLGPLWHLPAALASSPKYFLYIMTMTLFSSKSTNKYVFSHNFSSSHVWMWELDHKKCWAPKNWCFQIVVLENTLDSPLDSKEIKLANPKGNQPWIFTGRTDAKAPIV